MAILPDKKIVVTDGNRPSGALIALDNSLSAMPMISGATPELSGYHGVCVLPNGDYILGQFGLSFNVNQYSSSGSYIRTVYTTNINSLTTCHAISDTELLLIDYNANNDNNGDLVRMELVGTSWEEVSRWDQSASSLPELSSIYSFAVLSNGDIYILPQNPAASRNKKMILCANGDLAVCGAIGNDIISADDGFAQGLAVIPGTDDLIFATNKRLVRFNTNDFSTVDLLLDFGDLPSVGQVRHIIIR
jgi:hypothetical protein